MSQTSANAGAGNFAVFYALGDKFIAARLEDGSIVHTKGVTVTLNERSLLTLRHEHCTRECCAIEPTRDYRVTGMVVLKGEDPLELVVEQREWEEQRLAERNREFEFMFDSQTLGNYLGADAHALKNHLSGAIIVDLEVHA
jgi:hypothetical protein